MHLSIFIAFNLLAALAASSLASAQQFSCGSPLSFGSSGPNEGRTKIEEAGKSNETQRTCPTFTLSIPGFADVNSPGTCTDSFVFRDADEFACGSSASVDDHCCNPKGHKVSIKIYGPTNTCPQFPSTLPNSVAEAMNLVQCGEPRLVRKTFNYSAGLVRCRRESESESESGSGSSIGESGHLDAGGAYTAWHGSIPEILPEPNDTLMRGWHAGLDSIPPGNLPAPLGEVLDLAQSFDAVEGISATLRIAYSTDGIEHHFKLQGDVSSDGRFALTETTSYDHSEGATVISVDLSYDHQGFYYGQKGSAFYSAFPRTMSDIGTLLQTLGSPALSIVDWVRDPFAVSCNSAIVRSTSLDTTPTDEGPAAVAQVVETTPGLGLEGSRVFSIDVSGARPRPRKLTVRDASGNLIMVKEFRDYQEFVPGDAYPMEIVTSKYLPGSQSEDSPYQVTTLNISGGRPVSASRIKSWRRGSDLRKWYVFQ